MKKYRVTISDQVLDGVRDYLNFIAEDQGAPLTAVRWWEKALEKIFSLEQMPHRCPFAPENETEKLPIRMLIVDRCLFLFTIDEELSVVRILKLRHGSQLPTSMGEL